MGPQVGFTPEDVRSRLMRAGGAMALLMACVDTDTIRIRGRWRSDVIRAISTQRHRRSRKDLHCAWSNTGTMRSSHPPTGTKTPAPRIWASPQPLLGYSGRPGIGLVRIRQINSPYNTNISKSIPSSSVDNQIPISGKVALATVTSREKGGTTRTRAHTGTHTHFQILRR